MGYLKNQMTTIKSTCSNEELSAAVAEHCAGWTFTPSRQRQIRGHLRSTGNKEIVCWRNGSHSNGLPPFATDANAVLELLDKTEWQSTKFNGGRAHEPCDHWVNVPMGKIKGRGGNGPTFCRAACFALLRAAGVEVVD